MTRVPVKELVQEMKPENYRILGDPERDFHDPAPIPTALPGSITWCRDIPDEGMEKVAGTRASVVICDLNGDWEKIDCREKTLLLVTEPRSFFARTLEKYFSAPAISFPRLKPGD